MTSLIPNLFPEQTFILFLILIMQYVFTLGMMIGAKNFDMVYVISFAVIIVTLVLCYTEKVHNIALFACICLLSLSVSTIYILDKMNKNGKLKTQKMKVMTALVIISLYLSFLYIIFIFLKIVSKHIQENYNDYEYAFGSDTSSEYVFRSSDTSSK